MVCSAGTFCIEAIMLRGKTGGGGRGVPGIMQVVSHVFARGPTKVPQYSVEPSDLCKEEIPLTVKHSKLYSKHRDHRKGGGE